MNVEQGKKLVKLARDSITSYFSKKQLSTKEFPEKRGVFVTLHKINGELRGCIGFPEPIFTLGKATIESARAAAFSDPRFPPLSKEEFNNIIVEVSVLTVPTLIQVKDSNKDLEQIELGKDGLIAELGPFRGLLLPQVPLPLRWNVEQFLDNTCMKAGLPPKSWQQPDCKIYKFQAEIFAEEKPNSRVIKKDGNPTT